MELEDRYKALKAKVVERKRDFDAFIEMLETKTSWLTSPASTRFHLNEEKGLLKHSVAVAENLLKFRNFLAPEISDKSCVIVGLFHDVGKVGMPGKPLYIKNDNEWQEFILYYGSYCFNIYPCDYCFFYALLIL